MFSIQGSSALEAFRGEVRKALSRLIVPKVERDTSLDSFIQIGRAWQQQLFAERLVAVHWPEQFGGRGLSLVEAAVVQEELARCNSPQLLGLFGLTMVGPILIQFGSNDQQTRFLRNILNASEVWCQGFSEPGAGS
ncbi:MAG: acyl-CoA dehydrogenase family protein, partial [Bdellovibrionales bacterium]|nr:acyl-CoA dehydrogenase family protein [Bdellovibrionales bacterium]